MTLRDLDPLCTEHRRCGDLRAGVDERGGDAVGSKRECSARIVQGLPPDHRRREEPVMIRAGLAAVVLLFTGGCSETWDGSVYPNRGDLTRHHDVGRFSSLEACRSAALAMLADLKASERGNYECGRNCDDGSRFGGVKVCKETLR